MGTSIGAAPMKAGATIEIAIDGIGSLVNTFESPQATENRQ
jgi:2-keto-4-pentenoate hydratase/2-oxohepta-3-ene-1,7-dioic acid hydratase in catechol pathway